MKLSNYQKKILRNLGNFLLPRIIDVLCRSLKINVENSGSLNTNGERNNYIFAFWHGKMVVGWYLLKDKKSAAIISASKDGELLSNILKYWNYRLSRGSSSTGGKEALAQLVDFAKEDYNIAITPDGPKGPKNEMKAGCVVTAKKSGVPLVLVGIRYSKYWQLKSWDKLQIPKPFSKVNVILSEPVYVDMNLSYEETSKLIKDCEKKLNELDSSEKLD